MPIPPFWDALNPRLRKWIPLPGCSLPSWVAGHGWIIQNNSFLAGCRRGRGTTFQALFFSVTSLLSWGKELLARPQASPQTAGAPRRYGERREEVQAHLLLLSLLWEFLKAVRAQKTPAGPAGSMRPFTSGQKGAAPPTSRPTQTIPWLCPPCQAHSLHFWAALLSHSTGCSPGWAGNRG